MLVSAARWLRSGAPALIYSYWSSFFLLSYPLVKCVIPRLIPQLPVCQQLRLHHRPGLLAPPLGCNIVLQFAVSNKQIHCSSFTAFPSETKKLFKYLLCWQETVPAVTSCWTNRKWARCSQQLRRKFCWRNNENITLNCNMLRRFGARWLTLASRLMLLSLAFGDDITLFHRRCE